MNCARGFSTGGNWHSPPARRCGYSPSHERRLLRIPYPVVTSPAPANVRRSARTPFYRHLYIQVLLAVFLGIIVGFWFPKFGQSMKPLGDAFIKLIKMLIAPIIFCTVVHGIASLGDIRKLG